MQKHRLGNTQLEVSALGLGTVKLGRNQGVKYPHAFELPTDKAVIELLAVAKALGINLLDTAPAYGVSEERLGLLLQGRHDWVISTKVGEEFIDDASQFDYSASAIIHSVERSLKRLRTDYLDIVLVHSNGDDENIINEHDVFATLSALKQAGKIRAYGMSTKTVQGGMLAVKEADVVMAAFNLAYQDERPVIAYAHAQGKGVLVKKALASGHLQTLPAANPVAASLQYIFNEPGVSSVILGTLNPLHLQEAAKSSR